MGTRYDNRQKMNTSSKNSEDFIGSRGTKQIEHYSTPSFPELSIEDRYSLQNVHHVWTVGDHYWKLSHEYYGSTSLWWLIAWYNNKPTEGHVKAGDIGKISNG